MQRALIITLAAAGILTGTAAAHEVSASTVSVQVTASKVEVLQTTPLGTAAQVATLSGEDAKPSANGKAILEAVSQYWQVTGANAACALERQAFRLQHHDTEIQMRYLFVCEEGNTPALLQATWLNETPPDHFLIFTINADEKSKTVIFEHQDLAIDITQLN